LKNVRDMETGPILVHVVTQKGKGYGPAEAAADISRRGQIRRRHGAQSKSKPNAPSYQNVFGQSLVKEAQKDDKIVGITAAMPSGTGIDIFRKVLPRAHFDVGIAEQHAVTFAAGLATEGYKPFCAIYSTFLQRVTTRSSTTWRSRACRCASPSTAPAWSRRRRDPRRIVRQRLSRLPARLRHHGGVG